MPESARLPSSAAPVSAASPGAGSVNGDGVGVRSARDRAAPRGRSLRAPALPRARGIRARRGVPSTGGGPLGLRVGVRPRGAGHRGGVRRGGLPGLRPRGAKPGVAPAGVRALYLLFALGALFAGARGDQLRAALRRLAESALVRRAERAARDEPPQPLRRQAREGAPQRRPGRRSPPGGIVLPAAAMWVGGQFAPGRWPYYLLPRGELIGARRRHAPDAPRPDPAPPGAVGAGISGSTR